MNELEFRKDLATLLEVDVTALTDNFRLSEHNWDSLAVVSTIALADQHFGKAVEGAVISRCETLADLLHVIFQKNKN